MSFACQKNCYAKDFTTRVLSCKPAKLDGKDCYEVTLEDTVLFPEGGGQPDDRGTIDGVEVLRIVRKGSIAVHYTAQPVEEGKEVAQVVDWERRFDHMQQHSGQHLITAIADSMYGYKTTSWNLAIGKESKCFIELNTKSVSAEQMKAIEDSCNRKIQEQTVVNVRWLEAGDPELQEVRSRGLPDDHEGSVRVVEMVGIDTNMCCGTHVRNLTDIQAVKLLHVENKKGSTLLFYVAGERVFRMLGKCYSSEKTLTKLLSVGPEEHISAVKKLQEDSRSSAKPNQASLYQGEPIPTFNNGMTILPLMKKSRNLLRDLANLMSALHLQSEPPKPLAIFHRDDGDVEFMNVLSAPLAEKGVLTFVTVGGDRGQGQFLLSGKPEVVKELGPKIAEMMNGKGGGKAGKFQGKCQKLENRANVEQFLMEQKW